MGKKDRHKAEQQKPQRDWLKITGAVVLAFTAVYKYQQEMRPLVDVTAPDPIQTEWKDGTFRFEIPLRFQNQSPSGAVDVTAYHVFFTYPPGIKDQIETEVPDIGPKKELPFTVVKYIDTKTLTASTNFFQYQNLLVLTTWRSDNLVHAGQVFCKAQWYRLYLSMNSNKLGSYLTLVKSKQFTAWGSPGKKMYERLRGRFLEGETLHDAYDLQRINWQRGEGD